MELYLNIVYQMLYALYLVIKSSLSCIAKQIIPAKYRSKSVKGEIVLITGSGSGIGKLMAKQFARLGARLILVDIDQVSNEKTANEILIEGGNAKTFTCDLSNRLDIYKLADDVQKSIGNINILVNNAGIVTGKKFLESTDASIEKTFQVNTLSHFWLAKAFLPSMIEDNHGHVVTIASLAGLFGTAGLCDYCASKFACVGFDESLRNELLRTGKTGVKTTVVCPYYINTGMFSGAKAEVVPLLDQNYVADKIVEAVLTNQKVLILPRLMYLMYFLKGIFSNEVESHFSMNVMKTSQAMDHFSGRSVKIQ